jgi:hypothetical protein
VVDLSNGSRARCRSSTGHRPLIPRHCVATEEPTPRQATDAATSRVLAVALFILDDVCGPARLPVGRLRPRRPGATEHGPMGRAQCRGPAGGRSATRPDLYRAAGGGVLEPL